MSGRKSNGRTTKKAKVLECQQGDMCRFFKKCPFHHDMKECREFWDVEADGSDLEVEEID
jgi:hypothetical protein